jgi:hypothetical protein
MSQTPYPPQPYPPPYPPAQTASPYPPQQPQYPPQYPQQPPVGTPPVVDEQAAAAAKEARREASYGAQVILDYEGDAALGARGGAADNISDNTIIRDVDLIALGHDPVAPSNDKLGSPPNGMPGKGPEPKHRAVPEPEAA